MRITNGAFSPQAEEDIAKVRQFVAATADRDLATVFNAACVAAMEEVSYTRKDGQYLRWDPRSEDSAAGSTNHPLNSRHLSGCFFDKSPVDSSPNRGLYVRQITG